MVYMDRKDICARFCVTESRLKDWIEKDPTFPEPDSKHWFKTEEIYIWYENTVKNIVKMQTTLPFGTFTTEERNIIQKAEISFLHDYLYKAVPGLKTIVEEKERQDLSGGFYGHRRRVRWVTASHGVLGREARFALKQFDDYPSLLEEYEGWIYVMYIRSLVHRPSQSHADFNTYIKAFIYNDLQRKCNVDMAQSAEKKYGASRNSKLIVGSSYWGA